jgi:cholesterol transport system auxiliary component
VTLYFPKVLRAIPSVCAGFVCVLALSACSSSAPTTYDLSAVREVSGLNRLSPGGGQLLVSEPATVQVLDSDRIIVKDDAGAISFIGGGQWADRLPRLLQTRLIQTFENVGRRAAVGRPGDRIVGDYQLNTDIRAFQIMSGSGEAVVELSVKLINDKNGRVTAARIFTSRVPASAGDVGAAAAALDKAMMNALVDIVRWAR